jgi:hypothetical protein
MPIIDNSYTKRVLQLLAKANPQDGVSCIDTRDDFLFEAQFDCGPVQKVTVNFAKAQFESYTPEEAAGYIATVAGLFVTVMVQARAIHDNPSDMYEDGERPVLGDEDAA